MGYLPFIEDSDLIKEVEMVIGDLLDEKRSKQQDIYKNTIDPFSAVFDSFVSGIGLFTWLQKEDSRQIQKSLQNRIGEFHQNVLGSCHGWEVIDSVIDIKNDEKRIIAEIKNKYNTTKGSDKKVIYENLENQLGNKFTGYVGYYVEVVPRTATRYNVPFTPSDNILKKRKQTREDIRKIDGFSFYDLVTGMEGSLKMLYTVIPQVMEKVAGLEASIIKDDPLYSQIFSRTYG